MQLKRLCRARMINMSNLHYIIPIFVPHEGCPHACVFCNQDSITGTKSESRCNVCGKNNKRIP